MLGSLRSACSGVHLDGDLDDELGRSRSSPVGISGVASGALGGAITSPGLTHGRVGRVEIRDGR